MATVPHFVRSVQFPNHSESLHFPDFADLLAAVRAAHPRLAAELPPIDIAAKSAEFQEKYAVWRDRAGRDARLSVFRAGLRPGSPVLALVGRRGEVRVLRAGQYGPVSPHMFISE